MASELRRNNAQARPPDPMSDFLFLPSHPSVSSAHYAAMKPLWEMLADAGQKALTVTILDLPWNHQCYDAYHSMVRHIRRRDGSWTFDYRVFDDHVCFGLRHLTDELIAEAAARREQGVARGRHVPRLSRRFAVPPLPRTPQRHCRGGEVPHPEGAGLPQEEGLRVPCREVRPQSGDGEHLRLREAPFVRPEAREQGPVTDAAQMVQI